MRSSLVAIFSLLLAGAATAQTPKDVRNTAKIGPRAVPQLADYLTNPDVAVRIEAVKALTDIGGAGTLDPLIKANYKDKFGAAVGYLTGELAQFKLA